MDSACSATSDIRPSLLAIKQTWSSACLAHSKPGTPIASTRTRVENALSACIGCSLMLQGCARGSMRTAMNTTKALAHASAAILAIPTRPITRAHAAPFSSIQIPTAKPEATPLFASNATLAFTSRSKASSACKSINSAPPSTPPLEIASLATTDTL